MLREGCSNDFYTFIAMIASRFITDYKWSQFESNSLNFSINVKIEAPYSQVVSVREDFSALSRGETGDWRRGENVIGFDFLFNHQLVTTLHFPNVRPNVCG